MRQGSYYLNYSKVKMETEKIIIASSERMYIENEQRRKCGVCGKECYTCEDWPKDTEFACTDCYSAIGGLPENSELRINQESLDKLEAELGVSMTKEEAEHFIRECLKSGLSRPAPKGRGRGFR
jgi:hypothetical protein